MKAYSLDLREKIIETYEAGGITQRELAQRFRVSLYFVVMLLRRWRRDSTLLPKPRGATIKPRLTPEIMQFLDEQIQQECDLSLAQLVELVREKYNVSVSTKTISRMLRRENLRYKKNAFTPASEIRKESKI
jgi:transposase